MIILDGEQFKAIDDVKNSYKMMSSNNLESGVATEAWASYQLTANGLEVHNSKATLMPTGFGYGNTNGNCYTTELDMGEFTSGAKAKLWFDNYTFYGEDGNFNFDMCVLNNGVEFKNTKCKGIFGSDKYSFDAAYDPITVAISTAANANTATNAKKVDFTLAAQGKTYIHQEMEMTDTTHYVGINATNGTYNLKALRIYKASMKDINDFVVEGYETTSQFIRVNLSAVPKNAGAASVISCGEVIDVTTEVKDNTVVVKPANGAFPLDREILFTLTSITDEDDQTVNAEKRFKLKKFWTEDFENYETISQMTNYMMVLTAKGNYPKAQYTMAEVAVHDDFKNLYAIEAVDGNKKLKITNADKQVFTHYAGYPEREDWKDCILEVDVTSEGQYKYYLDIFQNMNSYNGTTGAYYRDGSHNIVILEANTIKGKNYGNATAAITSAVTQKSKDASIIVGPQSGNMVTYLNGDVVLSQPDRADASKVGGEFGFRTLYASTHYIDNIKMYKVEELSNGNVTVMSAINNSESNKVTGKAYTVDYNNSVDASKLIVAVYDAENRLIGTTIKDVKALAASEGVATPYEISYDEDSTAKYVRAFWWSDLNTLETLAGSVRANLK